MSGEIKMDAGLKAKWIAALRSGEFEQAKSRLFDGRAYCCLGVLCVVANHEVPAAGSADGSINADHYRFIDKLIGYGARCDCMERNDDGATFPQIADWLESQP